MDANTSILGVFKPVDEEACLSDQECYDEDAKSSSVLKYIRHAFHAGEGAFKEAAAYLLDHERYRFMPKLFLPSRGSGFHVFQFYWERRLWTIGAEEILSLLFHHQIFARSTNDYRQV